MLSVAKQLEPAIHEILQPLGFTKIKGKVFGRICEKNIFQFIVYNCRTNIRKEYQIQYGTMLLLEPSKGLMLRLGGDLERGSSGGSYGANNPKMLDDSIERVKLALKENLIPFYNRSDSLKKYIVSLKALKNSNPENYTGHCEFSISIDFFSSPSANPFGFGKLSCFLYRRDRGEYMLENMKDF